jgi:hypothetical protein
VPRQPSGPASAAVSGAKIVLASPASRVTVVSAVTRRGPHQRVSAANAGWYSVPDIANPTSSHAATNTGRVRAAATSRIAGTASSEPAVITGRGPYRSSSRPTGTPASADSTSAAENAAVMVGTDQPVSAPIAGASTGKP